MITMSSVHFDKRRRSDDAKKWMWGMNCSVKRGRGSIGDVAKLLCRIKERSKDCIKLTHGGAFTLLLRYMIVQCPLIWTRKSAPDILLCRKMMNLDAWRILVAILSKLKISVRIRSNEQQCKVKIFRHFSAFFSFQLIKKYFLFYRYCVEISIVPLFSFSDSN